MIAASLGFFGSFLVMGIYVWILYNSGSNDQDLIKLIRIIVVIAALGFLGSVALYFFT